MTEELKEEQSRSKSLEEKLHDAEQLAALASRNSSPDHSAVGNNSAHLSLPLTPTESPPTVSPAPQPSPTPSGLPPPPPAPPPPPVDFLLSTKNFFMGKSGDGPKKDVPKPRVNLKTVNWQKLSEKQLEGTIWKELKDEELYKVLDLTEIDALFATAGPKDRVRLLLL